MSDLTNGGRERAYQALRESEELHRATLGNISDAVFLTDDEGKFTFVCPNVDVIFGYMPDEVHAMMRINHLLGEDLFSGAELAVQGEIRNIEREVVSKSGTQRVVLVHVKKVSINGSTRLFTCRDVTELKHAEEELRVARLDLAHASRLALVGELMASVTHEINQPLTSILANASAEILRLSGDATPVEPAELREVLTEIRDQGRLAGDVIARIRALAGKRPLNKQPLDANEVIADILRLVGSDARRRHTPIRTELASPLPPIMGDRVSLQQVVLNLILNGMDAMDQQKPEERQLVLRTRRHDGHVEIEVSDSGHGISADRLPRLFEAFFTTKKDGLGLGLVIARSIVEAHGGRIWAENRDEQGATFRMALPAP